MCDGKDDAAAAAASDDDGDDDDDGSGWWHWSKMAWHELYRVVGGVDTTFKRSRGQIISSVSLYFQRQHIKIKV